MLKFYQYPRCSTCRNALKFLRDNHVEVSLVDITVTPPSVAELVRMLRAKGGEIKKLINTSGERYRELGLKDRLPKMSAGEILAILSREGKLIKRPFLLTTRGGVIGFREAEWRAALLG
jgi:arsenate reductase